MKWQCFCNYFSLILRICLQACVYLLLPVEKLFKIKANRRVLQPATSIDRSINLLILSIKHEETKKSNLDKVIEKFRRESLKTKC